MTKEAFETLVGKMIGQLKMDGPFDGVYLALHGAMAVRGVPRPEAELARRVREVVGLDTFISATFDLHGNEDEAFLKSADMAFAVNISRIMTRICRESAPLAPCCEPSMATTSRPIPR